MICEVVAAPVALWQRACRFTPSTLLDPNAEHTEGRRLQWKHCSPHGPRQLRGVRVENPVLNLHGRQSGLGWVRDNHSSGRGSKFNSRLAFLFDAPRNRVA